MGNATLIRGTVAAQVGGTVAIVDADDQTQSVLVEGEPDKLGLRVSSPELDKLQSILDTLNDIKLLIELHQGI